MNGRVAVAVAILLGIFPGFTSAAHAGSSVLAPPPDKFVISGGGVDMRSGRYAYSHTDLSIGGDDGLALTRSMTQQGTGRINPFGSFSDNFDIHLQLTFVNMQTNDFRPNAGADPQVEILFGGRAQTFQTITGNEWELVSHANYGILTPAPIGDVPPAVLTYQDSDGSTMIFRTVNSGDCSTNLCGDISQLIRPDGTVLSFQYDEDPASNRTRLRNVSSTGGQALIF